MREIPSSSGMPLAAAGHVGRKTDGRLEEPAREDTAHEEIMTGGWASLFRYLPAWSS